MSNKWDEAIQSYEHLFANWPHAGEYQGIFDLISKLREHPSFTDVIPGKSLATLFLAVPGKKPRIYVYIDGSTSLYKVYLGEGEQDWDHSFADANTIVSTLENYIQKLQSK